MTWRWFDRLRRRRAIKAYARKLPLVLRKDYGASPSYTPAQVKRSVERAGLNTEHLSFALCMFSDCQEFNRYHTALGSANVCDYHLMRAEVGHTCFEGRDFSIADMVAHFHDGAGGGHDGSSGHDAGSDGHGHDGHGGGHNGGH